VVALLVVWAGAACVDTRGEQRAGAGVPVVFSASESAGPGEVIGLVGANFGSAPQLWLARVSPSDGAVNPQMRVPSLNGTDDYVSARIPSSQPMGIYAIWVTNGAGRSQPVWINRARVTHLLYDQVSSGTEMRAFGRNLAMPGATPSARLVNASSGASVPAVVGGARSDLYMLRFSVPDGLHVGTSYRVYVSNGMGGSKGESLAPEQLTVRSPGSDPFGLGVPWGADYGFSGNVYNVLTDSRLTVHATANRSTNDQPAIQGAIDHATAHGGGVVYLPAGTYLVDADRLNVASNVVLRGDGIDVTTIRDTGNSGILFRPGSSVMGISNLTIAGPRVSWGSNIIMNASAGTPLDRIFLSHVRIALDTQSAVIEGRDLHHILVTDTRFDDSARTAAPLYWHQGSYITIRDTRFHFLNGRILLGDIDHLLWEANSSLRDYTLPDLPTPPSNGDSGHLDLQCTGQVVILNSTFRLLGPDLDGNNGESINTQCGSQPGRPRYYGRVTSADATHLTDAAQSFAPSAHGGRFAVWILRGPGLGEWRWLSANTSTEVTVDHPWDVIPTLGSMYAVREMDAYQFLIKGNLLTDNKLGIEHYDGAQASVIVDNTLVNSAEIWLRSHVQHDFTHVDVSPVWGCYVADNSVSATDQNPYDTAGIGTIDDDSHVPLSGALVLGNEFRRNTIHAEIPNVTFQNTSNVKDGYWAFTRDELSPNGMPRDGYTEGTLGTIFDGNQGFDTESAYWVDTGTYSTVIADFRNTRVGSTVADQTGFGASHASVGTTISQGEAPAPPGTAPPGSGTR
jgi:hypothetical protein